MKRAIVNALESSCDLIDALPNWTYPFVGSWLGCPRGLALWSSRLDERWQTGVWVAPLSAFLRCTCQPPSDEQLDRTLCACGHMHFYCECGRRTDDCPLDV